MKNVYRIGFITLCSLTWYAGVVSAAPFSEGNPDIGKTLVEKNCIRCHAAKYGGDGSGMYTRESRKINSSAALLAQVRNCNTMLDVKLFEDEELHIASYLNKTYYKFEK